MDKVNKTIAAKSQDDSKAARRELKNLRADAKQLAKDLAAAQKRTKQEIETAIARMADLEEGQIEVIKAKYKEVIGLMRKPKS